MEYDIAMVLFAISLVHGSQEGSKITIELLTVNFLSKNAVRKLDSADSSFLVVVAVSLGIAATLPNCRSTGCESFRRGLRFDKHGTWMGFGFVNEIQRSRIRL